jgi:hypothetical protein
LQTARSAVTDYAYVARGLLVQAAPPAASEDLSRPSASGGNLAPAAPATMTADGALGCVLPRLRPKALT